MPDFIDGTKIKHCGVSVHLCQFDGNFQGPRSSFQVTLSRGGEVGDSLLSYAKFL